MYYEIFNNHIFYFKTTKTQPIIIDAGANIGISTIYFKFYYPQSIITSFEPDPDIFDVLQFNINSLELTDVTALNIALWDKETNIQFYKEGADSGSILTSNKEEQTTDVTTKRLSSFLRSEVDFLKIDIEGAEVSVLKECKEQLRNVKNIFVEFHSMDYNNEDLLEILSILNSAGFFITITNSHPFNVYCNRLNLNSYSHLLNIHGTKNF